MKRQKANFLYNLMTGIVLYCALTDGQVIWKDTSMANINRKALKKLPEEESKKKEIRLRKTEEAAVDNMLNSLNKKAFQNVE